MLSVITPTFNRKNELLEAYLSLCHQTDFRFEWIIVDDGSNDGTENEVQKWISQNKKFNIRYIKQANGGKHRALNKAIPVAKFSYIIILDSDDVLLPFAVNIIHQWLSTIDNDKSFAGVSGLKGFKRKNKPIGKYLEKDYIDAKNNEREKFRLSGDKAEVYKKEILLKYPFPEFDNENFLSESAVWDKIAMEGYKIRWFNRIIYEAEYLEDGLTNTLNKEKLRKNFKGYTYTTNIFIKSHPYKFSTIGEFYCNARSFGFSRLKIYSLLETNIFSFSLGIIVKKFMNFRKSIKTILRNSFSS